MASSKRSELPISSSVTDGNLEERSRFKCTAHRLDRASVSRKHTFNEQHAEKLMKKHMKKKAYPVIIFSMEDRLLFRSTSGSQPSKRWQSHAKYADIRHFYINCLNPRLFMLCVEDSEHKNKKYYESFQCDTAESVNKLCDLTASAKATETNMLPPLPQENLYNEIEETYTDSKVIESEELVVNEAQPRVASMAPLSPLLEHEGELEPSLDERYTSVVNPVTDAVDMEIAPSPCLLSQTKPQLASLNLYDEAPAKISASSVPCSPLLFVRDSRRQSKVKNIDTPKVPVKSERPRYRTYQSQSSWPRRTKSGYSRAELPQLFGEDVTFLSMDNQTGAIMCDSGPVFLYALRLTETVESYEDENLVPGSNSRIYERVN